MASRDSQGGASTYVAGDSNRNTSPETYSPRVHQQFQSRREQIQKIEESGDVPSASVESKTAHDGGYCHEQDPCCSNSNLAITLGNSTSEDADDEGDVKQTIKELKDIKTFIEEIDAARRRGIRRSAPIQAPGPHMGMQQEEVPQAGTAYVPSLQYFQAPSSSASERNRRGVVGESAPATARDGNQKQRESSGADFQSSGNLFRMSM